MDPLQTARTYQEAILQLERTEAYWLRIDELLRRLVTRLTYAAEGRSLPLDVVLGNIRRQARSALAEEMLEPLISSLTEAVTSLDDIEAAAPDTAAARDMLLALLDRLQLEDALSARIDNLREAIAAAPDPASASPFDARLAGLVNRHCRQIGEQKAAAERLLTQVTVQLDQLTEYLTQENADHQQGSGSRQDFDRRLSIEISALGTHLQQAPDVGSLQTEVQSRLGAIGAHLRTFREREEARERDWQARAEQMNQRIHELERSAQAMELNLRQEHQLASTDPLTGIANRLVFEQYMAEACRQVAQAGGEACLLVLDIDHFKQINDRFGHAAGDRALRIVAEQLQARVRRDDLLARYGGEEFVVVLNGSGAQAGHGVAETLRTCIESLGFRGQQQPIQITLSCGLTAVRPGDTPDSAFERADRALYLAKRGGRNRCETL
jgi:diguanylate cyclase